MIQFSCKLLRSSRAGCTWYPLPIYY